ncbi:hypothetical protein [Streptomyces chrestomyceticus]|uniref:hypothetical protein n=1 Tax=Streptomyces chrestomyceticus TaxID=68185 RepID=UPI0033E2DE8A
MTQELTGSRAKSSGARLKAAPRVLRVVRHDVARPGVIGTWRRSAAAVTMGRWMLWIRR